VIIRAATGAALQEFKMPLFEYHCPACGAEFEKLVGISQRDDVACAHCGAPRASRKPSTFAAKTAGGGSVSAAPVSAPRFT
jgi:putative FmdB family regulatory protein